MRKGSYIKVDTKDDSYFALNDKGEKLKLTIGKKKNLPKNIKIMSPLADRALETNRFYKWDKKQLFI